jgi:endonuclease YncB( thermonuclease family)
MNASEILIAPERPSPYAVEVPVLKVFDGDGFLTRIRPSAFEDTLLGDVEIEAPVRFGFVDAPELDQPGGAEAKEFRASLIGGRTVLIEILLKADTGRSFDRYGRLVCTPYLKQEYATCTLFTAPNSERPAHRLESAIALTRNIELEMVLNGWAWVLERYGPDHRYLEALEDARKNRRGIWASSGNVHPWTFKARKGAEETRHRQVALEGEGGRCPRQGCGGHLVRRSGRYGGFWGCSEFPKCGFSRSVAPG